MNNIKLALFPLLIFSMVTPSAVSKSKDIGSIIFDLPELQQVFTKQVETWGGRQGFFLGATQFLEEVMEDGGILAIIIWDSEGGREFATKAVLFEYCVIAVAVFDEKQRDGSRMKAGAWFRNLLERDIEHQLAYYDARIPLPNDLEVFNNEPKVYQKLSQPVLSRIANFTFFMVLDGDNEIMIRADSSNAVSDIENSPINRSATFARLYQLGNEIFPGLGTTVEEMIKNGRGIPYD